MSQGSEEKYRNAIHQRRPEHAPFDDFSCRHPKMSLSRRAKIFAPFAALRGFDLCLENKLESFMRSDTDDGGIENWEEEVR